MKIKNPKDFWAGLMFIAFGLFFVIGARDYQLGSAARMGPAYFPTLLGGLMAMVGGIVFFRSFVLKGEKVAAFPLRLIFFYHPVAAGVRLPAQADRSGLGSPMPGCRFGVRRA